MKKIIATALSVVLLASVVIGSTGCMSKAKKEWYKETLEYYRDGVKNGFKEEINKLDVPDELKDGKHRIGYLLRDLDGDKVDELLIGIIDDDINTKFTNVVVRHGDLGPYCLISGTNGYYTYLCSDNVLLHESWRGSDTEKRFMRWDHKSNAFTIIEGEGKYLPMKWELTEF